MSELSREEKELVFDYAIGIATDDQVRYVQRLIRSSTEAAALLRSLNSTLAPLAESRCGPCPDALVSKTLRRLAEAANGLSGSGHTDLPEVRIVRISSWRNLAQTISVAAVLMVCVGVAVPALRYARHSSYQKRCQAQLASIYDGLSSYTADHNGRLPSVAMASGSPWWKVGYQGPENHSNTRPVWLLVKNGYARPADFMCPERKGTTPGANTIDPHQCNDFPSLDQINYSFRLCCDKDKANPTGLKVIMADRNPLAERLPNDYSSPLKIHLDESVLRSNSRNHLGRGQNVLTCDGSVQFHRARLIGIGQDDIFSLSGMTPGCQLTGCEVPSTESDAFLAP